MEDIQIWSIDGKQAAQLETSNRMESEHLLEETLVNNPGLLLEDLTLVGRQTPTEGGPLDLIGIDGDGRLVVFELKRGTLSRDAVAQIIDYASYLNDMDLTNLASHISESSGAHGIDEIEDFEDWYISQDFVGLESLKPLRLFLVGLGTDNRTERMVRFLADNSGMDISLLTFHGFNSDGKTILAKQVEVEGNEDSDSQPTRARRTIAELEEQLNSRIKRFEMRELFDAVREMFRENWLEPYSERPAVHGLGIRLRNRSGTGRLRHVRYARIDALSGTIRIVFFRESIDLCRDDFGPLLEEIPYQTHPRNREPLDDAKELHFLLSKDNWDIHKDGLATLTQEIYSAWQNSVSGE